MIVPDIAFSILELGLPSFVTIFSACIMIDWKNIVQLPSPLKKRKNQMFRFENHCFKSAKINSSTFT